MVVFINGKIPSYAREDKERAWPLFRDYSSECEHVGADESHRSSEWRERSVPTPLSQLHGMLAADECCKICRSERPAVIEQAPAVTPESSISQPLAETYAGTQKARPVSEAG
jgi:hypothetical protein